MYLVGFKIFRDEEFFTLCENIIKGIYWNNNVSIKALIINKKRYLMNVKLKLVSSYFWRGKSSPKIPIMAN